MTQPEVAPRSRRLGQVAFVIALVVFVGSIVISIFTGVFLGNEGANTPFSADFATGAIANGNTASGALALVQVILGTGLGIWAIVQGIIAAVQRRGRVFGIVAIVLAALAPGLSLLVFFLAGAVGSSN